MALDDSDMKTTWRASGSAAAAVVGIAADTDGTDSSDSDGTDSGGGDADGRD